MEKYLFFNGLSWYIAFDRAKGLLLQDFQIFWPYLATYTYPTDVVLYFDTIWRISCSNYFFGNTIQSLSTPGKLAVLAFPSRWSLVQFNSPCSREKPQNFVSHSFNVNHVVSIIMPEICDLYHHLKMWLALSLYELSQIRLTVGGHIKNLFIIEMRNRWIKIAVNQSLGGSKFNERRAGSKGRTANEPKRELWLGVGRQK